MQTRVENAYDQNSLAPIRPIRLFEQPERIEAIASVPDGPPVQFTWRRVRYAVAHVEGPERIALDWWRDNQGHALTRDYFRVESREGMRVWLYREGAFNGSRADALVPARRVRMSNVHPFSAAAKQPRAETADATAPAYAELAVTTNFSFLRGGSHPEELVERAIELGIAGLGIADRNTVAGVVRAHTAALEEDADGKKRIKLKIAPGARLVFADGTPDILAYPQDRAAWGRLTRLLTVGKSRGEKAECILYVDDLLEHIEGLNLIVLPADAIDAAATTDLLARLKTAAASPSVWLAAGMLYRGDDRRRLMRLIAIAGDAAVPLIAVNDVLYHAPERRVLQDIVTCIREHVTSRPPAAGWKPMPSAT